MLNEFYLNQVYFLENLFLSLKPLLDCLSFVDKDSKGKIAQSIQLICCKSLNKRAG